MMIEVNDVVEINAGENRKDEGLEERNQKLQRRERDDATQR
jgi:hypothetical protein